MHILDSENDPRILRDLAKQMNAEILRLNSIIKKIQEEKAKKDQEVFEIELSLKILKNKYFCSSSEKTPMDRRRERMNEDSDILLHSQNIVPPVKEKKIRKLKEEVQIHESTNEDLISMSASLGLENPSLNQWEEIVGLYDQSVEIEIIEREYKKIVHKRAKHKLKKEFNTTEKEIIITAPGPVKLLPGASYSINFAAAVVTDKYLNHIPLERQCRIMESLSLSGMHTQTLYNLCRVTSEYLNPICGKIKKEILKESLVHCDETTWPINNSKDSDGYMWILSNKRGSLYTFEPTRSGKIVKELLEDYFGSIMTDGYSGYMQFRENNKKNVNKNKLALCHAHARRYFWDIKDNYPIVMEMIDLYQDLFFIEKQARTFEELKNLRQLKSKPIIEKMKLWLTEKLYETRSQDHFKKAIEYSLNHWPELIKFLDDPDIPLTNNEAERTIRQAVMGRKNFYGSRSIDGADVAANIYTIIESCKKVELDPRKYLIETIKKAAAGEPTPTPYELASSIRQ